MNRIFLLLTALGTLLLPAAVNAHILETNSTIGVVLHVDPEDKPIANGQNTFLLEFKDTENKFSLDNCECFLTISQDEKDIQKIPITPVSANEKLSAAIPYIFPAKGVYNVEVAGSPINGATFSKFDFDFDEEVSREAESPTPQPTVSNTAPAENNSNKKILLDGGLLLLLIIIAIAKFKPGKKSE